MPVELVSIWKGDKTFEKTMDTFVKGWDATEWKRPNVHFIFKAEYKDHEAAKHHSAFERYAKEKGKIQYLLHGIKRTCRTGDHRNWTKPCHNHDCLFCTKFLKTSQFDFKWDGENHRGLFGEGLYGSLVSSKAAQYAESTDANSKFDVMLVCKVATGKTFDVVSVNGKYPSLDKPPHGYDSITVKINDRELEATETAVYVPEALIVSAVVVYEKPSKVSPDCLPGDEGDETAEGRGNAADDDNYDTTDNYNDSVKDENTDNLDG